MLTKNNIYYARQSINSDDIKNVSKALKKRQITQNDDIHYFEKKLSTYTGSKYCVVVNSATSALHLSYKAVGVNENNYIITSPISFVSTANAAHFCNSKVEFSDINLDNYCLDHQFLDKLLQNKLKKKKPLPKIIVNVHLGGNASNSQEIYKIAKKYKIKVIEDASHSLGSISNNYFIGSCKYSALSVTSFHPIKTITTGEGGCIFTNSKKIYNKLKLMREHYITRNKKSFWKYSQKNLGYNYRMSGINASLGISQLKRIDDFVKQRNEIAKYYEERLRDLPISFQKNNNENFSSCHLFIIRLIKKNSKINQSKLFNFLKRNNIICALHYPRIDKQPFYSYAFKNNMKNAKIYEDSSISLPIYNDLKKAEQNRIINLIRSFFD